MRRVTVRYLTRAVALLVGAGMVAAACIKVPYTGRRQFNLVPDSVMNGLGTSSYTQMLAGKRVAKSGTDHQVLQRVGQRISRAAQKPKFKWQYSMIEDNTVNAWCLPGGKIGFYSGILPILKNEAGMAAVMGHEVAHATARHGAERLSQNLAVVGGVGALQALIAGQGGMSDGDQDLVLAAIGVGAQVGVLLPFSRKHESEADVIGLMYAAAAGYPPDESVEVWNRMGQMSGGGDGPGFLSTHPSHDKRKETLREWMPTAEKRYQRNALPGNMKATIWSGGVPANGSTKTKPSNKPAQKPNNNSTKPTKPNSGSSKPTKPGSSSGSNR